MTKKIKMTALALSLLVSSAAFATTEGWFVGAGVGATSVSNKSATLTAVTNTSVITIGPITPSKNGFGARLFTGYNFNHYSAVEFGYTYFGASTYKIPSSAGVIGSDPQIHQNVFDVLGKVSMPFFNSGFEIFAKGGLAVVRLSKSKTLITPTAGQIASCQSTAGSTPQLCPGSSSPTLSARPEFAIGASYDFTPNWVMELSYAQILKGGNIPNMSFASISFSYHWVDRYCGQFLC